MTREAPRLLFVNENIGGHATMHANLRREFRSSYPGIPATFFDVPPAGVSRRLVGARIPGLARWDADLQPLRAQLALSWHVRRHVRPGLDGFHSVHWYTHNASLLSWDLLRAVPSVVALDGTNRQNAFTLPTRSPGPGTEATVRLTARFERGVYAAATLLVAQSHWVARSLQAHYGINPDKIRVIPVGVPIPAEIPYRGDPDRPLVTFIGTSLSHKGGHRLLRLFRNGLRAHCQLALVTREQVPAEPGLRVYRDFVPGDPRLPDLLAKTAVFAFPSEIDNRRSRCWRQWPRGCPWWPSGTPAPSPKASSTG